MIYLRKFFGLLLHTIVFIIGIWCIAAIPTVLNMNCIAAYIFSSALTILIIGMFFNKNAFLFLCIAEFFLILNFVTITPEEQFKNVTFQKRFGENQRISFLADGKFHIENLRNFHYRSVEDFDIKYMAETFDPAKVHSVDVAVVYWDNMFLVAHTMLNFNFSDGKKLSVSAEPKAPENMTYGNFKFMCKRHKLMFVLSHPGDLFFLRLKRGEDLYLYRMNLTPEQSQILLNGIIRKAAKLNKNPEFYHLLTANCITAWISELNNAHPVKYDYRVIFNGMFDRMLFEQNLLVKKENESFESLKSRSFINRKEQDKL